VHVKIALHMTDLLATIAVVGIVLIQEMNIFAIHAIITYVQHAIKIINVPVIKLIVTAVEI
jgi:hypothetical protein